MRSVVKNYFGMVSIAVIAMLIFGALAVRIDRDQTPNLPDGVHATPAVSGNSPDMLVDANWLVQYQNHVDYIYDLGDQRLYEEGHIPNARHISWLDAMRLHTANYGEVDQISLGSTDDDVFGRLSFNVPQNARIILYDSNNSERASWMLWVMTINGYTDVHVLDGGLQAWIGAGGELTTDVPPAPNVSVQATPTWNDQYEIRREPLLQSLEDPNLSLIDTRTTEQAEDTVNGTVRLGHIPGSVNIPNSEIMRADGTFKSSDELQAVFESFGIDPEDNVVVYSLFTIDSGNVWLALNLAGYENVVIYNEGFVAWGHIHVDLPVTTDPYPTDASVSPPLAATPEVDDITPMATENPRMTPEATPSATPDDDGPTDLT